MKSATSVPWLLSVLLLFSSTHVLEAEGIPFRFLLTSVTVEETDSVARLQVLRADDADHPINVDFVTESVSATAAADYTPVAGTLTFFPGEHFKLIEVPILNDGFTEIRETFNVVLTNATELGISETSGVATITIRDNDPGFSFETSTYNPSETQSEVVLNVRRGSDSAETISVDYAIEPDSATPGIDYLPVSGTLSFGPKDMLQSIRVPIVRDFLKESLENFRVVLSNPSTGASLGSPSTAAVRLIDDDTGFKFINFNYNSSTYIVAEGPGEAVLYVARGTDAPGESSVEYSVEPISATPDLDYTPVRGTLTFSSEQSSQIIRVPILGDGLKESAENFRVLLSNPSAGAELGTPSVAIVRIENNDSGFSFSGGSSYSIDESGRVVLTVDRGSDLLAEISVEYITEPVSATPDLDYTPVSGKLVFTTNIYSQTIEIPLINDQLSEATESFRVVLRNPSPGTSLGTPSVATIRIVSNDPGFSFGNSAYSILEGSEAVVWVNRGTDPVGEVSVDYSVEADSATAGLDFTPVSGRLTFLDKETYKTIQIPTIDDSSLEATEAFRVILSNPSAGVSLGSPATATVRIMDNDAGVGAAVFSFVGGQNFSVAESGGEVALTIYRNGDATSAASVDFSTVPDTASPDQDYTPVRGTVLFAAQEISKKITVPILNDMISEGNESFSVVLSNPSVGALIGTPDKARVTIQDDDIGFVFECTPGDPYCGYYPENIGSAKVDVVIRGDFKFTNAVSVDFVTEAGTAAANVDFLATSGTLTFAPGETRKTVSIPLLNDGLFEANETFRIALRDPVGLTQVVALPRFTFTIWDNDRGYRIESNSEDGRFILPQTSGDVLINVHRLGDFNYRSSVDFRTSGPGEQGSTASPGVNFVAGAGTLTFGPGETNKTITLRLIDDHRVRLEEQFFIELSNPTGGVPIADGMRSLVIQPNERNPLRLDPDFSAEARYARGYGEYDSNLQMLPDGRIVIAASLAFLTGEDGLGIVRLLRDGTLDPSFTVARISGFNLLALQTNHQVLVGGGPQFTINGDPVLQLARLNVDGSLDSTFQLQLPNTNVAVTAVAAQSDGKILVATYDNVLVRLNANGSLDSSFQRVTAAPIRRIVVDTEGRAVILGDFGMVQNKARPGMARLFSDGSLDPSFLADWQLGQISRFEPEAKGTFLVYDALNTLGRLTVDGRIDPTFQADARLGYIEMFAPAPDHKVVVSEQKPTGSGIVSRLNADGSFDDSFLPGTYTATLSGEGWGATYSIVPEVSGDLLIRGDIAAVNGISAVRLGRLLLNGGSPPVVIDPGSAEIRETNGLVTLTLVRTGNNSEAYTVNWATDRGTALPGVDFLAASGTVTFAPGESTHAISLQLLDNQELDADRTVRLSLTARDGAVLPSVTFIIVNDEIGFLPGGSYAFPNGRFLMNITGTRTRANINLQRSTDMQYWEDWRAAESQIIDSESFSQYGAPRMFYRLIEY